jgi:photosystem II oxygen-evolving enhancer protein 1
MQVFSILAMATGASAFAPAAPARQTTAVQAKVGPAEVAAAAIGIASIVGGPIASQAITTEQLGQLSYEQVKGTGLANRCPEVVGEGSLNVPGNAEIVGLCIEPKSWAVAEEKVDKKTGKVQTDFVNSKMMTRQTYSLADISGSFGGSPLTFKEEDGIDYAPTTVQLPGGERVPFLFTVKELKAVASTGGNTIKPGFEMGGKFKVPSYRTGLFLDPKGRGMTTGYDQAQALPGYQNGVDGDAELFNENNKKFDIGVGNIEFEVNKVNAEDGEIGGVFVSTQPPDTDLGSKDITKHEVLSKGIWFAKVQKRA